MRKFLIILAAGMLFFVNSFADNLKIVDGDTIVLNGEKIRFSGIDTPELKQICMQGDQKVSCGMNDYKAKFKIGQIVHHKLFDYSGVVFDIDPFFQSSDEWYEQVAQSRPPKNKPWYHVLVHTAEHTTYVAEQNLDLEKHPKSIQHPLINSLFAKFDGSQYHLKSKAN